MRKFILVLIAIFIFAIFHQCTKSTIPNEEYSSKAKIDDFDYDKFIQRLNDKGIFTINDANINLRSVTGDGCYAPGIGCVRDTFTDTI
jgi:hypothetical protein